MHYPEEVANTTLKSYLIGFVLSILLTLAAYLIVMEHLATGQLLITAVVALGFFQGWVQLVLFLHLGKESHPRRNLMTFLFMLLVGVILVAGSIWIMAYLDYNHMPHMPPHMEMK
jgi:cytochrome o ubiquinol oxidase subunit IV